MSIKNGNKIIISIKDVNILSIILFFTSMVFSVLFQYVYFGYIYLKVSTSMILSPIILAVSHEVLHYIGFILFSDIKHKEIKLKLIKPSPLPLVTTSESINRNGYIYTLLFPTLVLVTICFSFILSTSNIAMSIILAGAVGIGSGDLLIAKDLFSLNKSSLVIPCEDEMGFIFLLGNEG